MESIRWTHVPLAHEEGGDDTHNRGGDSMCCVSVVHICAARGARHLLSYEETVGLKGSTNQSQPGRLRTLHTERVRKRDRDRSTLVGIWNIKRGCKAGSKLEQKGTSRCVTHVQKICLQLEDNACLSDCLQQHTSAQTSTFHTCVGSSDPLSKQSMQDTLQQVLCM